MSSGAKPTRQRRSRQKRDEILAALDLLLAERPFEQISVQHIALASGVSVATIYQRFSNRKAATSVLIELYQTKVSDWDKNHKDRVGIAAAVTLKEALRKVGEDAWRQFDALGYVMRPAYLASRQDPDALGEQWAELEASALRGFQQLLSRYLEIDADTLQQCSGALGYFYNMMLLGKLLHAEGMGSWIGPDSADNFGRVLADFAIGYLRQRLPQLPV